MIKTIGDRTILYPEPDDTREKDMDTVEQLDAITQMSDDLESFGYSATVSHFPGIQNRVALEVKRSRRAKGGLKAMLRFSGEELGWYLAFFENRHLMAECATPRRIWFPADYVRDYVRYWNNVFGEFQHVPYETAFELVVDLCV